MLVFGCSDCSSGVIAHQMCLSPLCYHCRYGEHVYAGRRAAAAAEEDGGSDDMEEGEDDEYEAAEGGRPAVVRKRRRRSASGSTSQPISYGGHYKVLKTLYGHVGITYTKKTHAARGAGARELRIKG